MIIAPIITRLVFETGSSDLKKVLGCGERLSPILAEPVIFRLE